jgi:hypothetical protein
MHEFRQHECCAITILDVGAVDHGMHQISVSVGQDVTLAAFDLPFDKLRACLSAS